MAVHSASVCSGLQVKAYQVFSTHGPQPYALAVLGKFSGALASASNPASQQGGYAQAATCRIVVAMITDGPQGLTNKTCALPALFLVLGVAELHAALLSDCAMARSHLSIRSSQLAVSGDLLQLHVLSGCCCWCRAIAFVFSTASGSTGSIKYECALTLGDQKNTTAVFRACQSPLQYTDLMDGEYQFYVRAQGEEIADSRAFTKVQIHI